MPWARAWAWCGRTVRVARLPKLGSRSSHQRGVSLQSAGSRLRKRPSLTTAILPASNLEAPASKFEALYGVKANWPASERAPAHSFGPGRRPRRSAGRRRPGRLLHLRAAAWRGLERRSRPVTQVTTGVAGAAKAGPFGGHRGFVLAMVEQADGFGAVFHAEETLWHPSKSGILLTIFRKTEE